MKFHKLLFLISSFAFCSEKPITEQDFSDFIKLDDVMAPDSKAKLIKILSDKYSNEIPLLKKEPINKSENIIVLSNPNQKPINHEKFEFSSVISPFGKFILLKNGDLITFFNNKKLVFNLNTFNRFNDQANFDYREEFLVTAEILDSFSEITLWDLRNITNYSDSTQIPQIIKQSKVKPNKIEVSVNGNFILMWDDNQKFIELFDTKSPIFLSQATADIGDIKFSPTKKIAALAYKEQFIILINLADNQIYKIFYDGITACYKILIKDNFLLAEGYCHPESTVNGNLFDLDNLKEKPKSLKGRSLDIKSEKIIYSQNKNYSLKLSKFSNPQLINNEDPNLDAVNFNLPYCMYTHYAAFTNSGKFIVTSHANETRFWDISKIVFNKYSLAQVLFIIKTLTSDNWETSPGYKELASTFSEKSLEKIKIALANNILKKYLLGDNLNLVQEYLA